MHVTYVGNFTRPWCTEVHVAESLASLGHTVDRVQENTVDFARLRDRVLRVRSSLLLWTRTWQVDDGAATKCLRQLDADGVPTVSFHLDRFFGLDREYLIDTQSFFRTSLLVSPDDGPWQAHGVNHLWLPPGVFDRECGRVAPNRSRFPWQVVFVGSHPYPHPEWAPVRARLLAAFTRAFGPHFAVLPQQNRPLRGRHLQQLYSTVPVVLGDSCLVGSPKRYWSDRIPETLGRGAALVHPYVDGIDDWYEHGEHLLTYPVDDVDTAVDQARWLLDAHDDRERIAQQGMSLVRSRDTYRHRMQTVLDHVGLTDRAVVHVRYGPGVHGDFELVEGDSDRHAVSEVWEQRSYPIDAAMVKGREVVDIGANVGAFSVLAAKLGAAKVRAYEPHPENFACLVRNVAANRVAHVVECLPFAVRGDANRFAVLSGAGGAAHLVDRKTDDADRIVEAVNVDKVVHGHEAVLKLDCEGSEYDLIEHLTSWPDRIFLEWHGPAMPHLTHLDGSGTTWGAMIHRLADHGAVSTFGHPERGGLLTWKRY